MTYAKPYIADLVEAIDRRTAVAPLLQAISALLAPGGPVLIAAPADRVNVAIPHLRMITDHFGRQYDIVDKHKDFLRHATFWAPHEVNAAEAELPGALEAIATLHASLPDDVSFTDAALAFLSDEFLAFTYPQFGQIYKLALLTPLSNATSERLFSSLKITKPRLRACLGDENLNSLLVVGLESGYTDVDGFPLDLMRRIVNVFVGKPNRKLDFTDFDEYDRVRKWVLDWRKSL
eukprot:TRINITY_DN2109_c0_g2_i11.p1 TRINITY_DN2109_c0_g2~~TRINITY_DN2109_c0_g2_i11.p1  ORF type:complete len:234 (+),score=40.44 TRINITY_DN2109_c0_g2_i11:1035-1736(+)